MPIKDPEARRAYQRQWIAARRERWFAENGPCVQCGSNVNLQLDHIDPAIKISHRIWSWSQRRLTEELAKCQVLCEECHKKKTAESYEEPPHGTDSRYCNPRYRCRCDECTDAHRVYKNDQRANRRAKGLRVT